MPAAAKGVEDLRSHRLTRASLFFEDTLRGNAIFFLPGKGRAAWMLRNVTPMVTRYRLPSSEIHSEVYNTDERARLQAHDGAIERQFNLTMAVVSYSASSAAPCQKNSSSNRNPKAFAHDK